jgi:hypothetical protein
MTGRAFLAIIDENAAAPNIGEPEEEMFKLAANLGLEIQGYHTFADKETFERLQREAWDSARSALDRGLPVFAKELDLGNETSVIYAYSDEGYFTHSWHGGDGHEGADDVIPWTMLGRNYCPCASCMARKASGEWANDGVYQGDPEKGGFISLHWASLVEPADDRTALRAAIRFAVDFSKRGKYEWGGRTLFSGTAAYDRWIETLRNDNIEAFYMGYYTDLINESRQNAHWFLREAAVRFDGELSEQLGRAADLYQQIAEVFSPIKALFPFSQPHAPIANQEHRRIALDALIRIRDLETEGYARLEKLLLLI